MGRGQVNAGAWVYFLSPIRNLSLAHLSRNIRALWEISDHRPFAGYYMECPRFEGLLFSLLY
jgi:hypothetical protein